MARHPNEFLVSHTFCQDFLKSVFSPQLPIQRSQMSLYHKRVRIEKQRIVSFGQIQGTNPVWPRKQSVNLKCSGNLQCPLPVESLNLLGIVKVFFPLFRHDHQVLPLLIQSLLKESQHLIKYSYFTCFDANIIILYDLLGHFIDQSSNN